MKILNELFSKIYVITLENGDRQKSVSEKLKNIDFEFFYGVNGKQDLEITPSINEPGFCDIYSEKHKIVIKGINRWSPGEYGCALSHLLLYKKIKEQSLNNVLILEDDFDILKHRLHMLSKAYKSLPTNWDLLYLGFTNTHGNYDTILTPNYNTYLFKGVKYTYNGFEPNYHGFMFLEGTGAMVVNNNFCDVMIKNQSDPKNFFTADGAIMYYGCRELEYYAVIPQIIPQDLKIKTTIHL